MHSIKKQDTNVAIIATTRLISEALDSIFYQLKRRQPVLLQLTGGGLPLLNLLNNFLRNALRNPQRNQLLKDLPSALLNRQFSQQLQAYPRPLILNTLFRVNALNTALLAQQHHPNLTPNSPVTKGEHL